MLCFARVHRSFLVAPRYLSKHTFNGTHACSVSQSIHSYDCSMPELMSLAQKEMVLINNFITEDEEQCLMKDIEPKWKRLKYQFDHWDDAIQGYRETEVSNWSETSSNILNRLRNAAFAEKDSQRALVHVLDLAEDGYIKPHVDSVKFCGRVIAGLSLLTPSVMRLINEKDKSKQITVLLNRRSLYIMRDSIRFEYTHEILKNEESLFRGTNIPKGRRMSVICRSEPISDDCNDSGNLFKVIKLNPD
uniref:alpha-ketoglutarate-dependent dioxygenase alkB homolog 7, mitochondrial-like n=1 Tax=Styela clava TaxID=7725 RepID=UPI0019392816|nr:alpha-ketoglutarate-dependent dioxygenase alkB homolog 7, mitochondrial-like [Styela clava]XP_039252910.1 alpha-ketoglutarate-dependent dioxygenase alkB homolog 7, mitochondrial-like [Styela clava]